MSRSHACGRRLSVALLLLACMLATGIAAPANDRAEAQQNTPATGMVTITGTARVGELLTADASLITDADGLTGVAFTFVWMAGATNDPAQATIRIYSNGPRYHVDPDDAGLKIMVDVRFRDDTDNFESVLSATTGVVAAVAPAPPLSVTASSTAPGELSLRWLPPHWMLQDWLAGRPSIGDGGADITGYKVQWKRSTGSWTVPADVSEETATDTRHVVRNLTGGAEYTLRVIAINAEGDSPPSHEVTVTLNRIPTGAPTLTGTPRVGEVLTIGTSGITDGDGLTNPRFRYGWLVEPEPPNSILSRLHQQPNWIVRPIDVGRTIQALVYFVDNAGFSESLLSTPTTVVAPSAPDAPRNLKASPGGGDAWNLEWEAPTWNLPAWLDGATNIGDGGSPITGYTVQWRQAAGDWAIPSDVTQAVVAGRTSHTIPNLTNGVPYVIRVIATNAIGDSEPSTEVEVPRVIIPPITGGGGVTVGGGGGGGPSGPTPSEADFEWTVKHDIDELDGGHGSPTGMWSDHTTLWIAQNGDGAADAIYAYDLDSGERQQDREFELDQANRAPRGLWSDGETMWVSDSGRERLFAYDLAGGDRLPDRDLALASRNADARGIWSDATTMWVLDGVKNTLFAYDLASGDLLAEYALDSTNGDPHGIWSDDVAIWVSDQGAKTLLAYRIEGEELRRSRDEDFTLLSRASNNSPRGIWSDGEVMYVADASDDKVYTYNMPDALDARLASITLSDLEIGEFKANQTDYTATLGNGVTQTTVEAAAAQRRARVATVPDDADGDDANGHQVALKGATEITVTVTSTDGSRTRVYRIAIERPVETIALVPTWTSFQWPGADGTPIDEALRGEGSAGNDISDNVTAVYQWDEAAQSWLAFFPGLEDAPGANTLATLQHGAQYWIAATELITWTVAIDLAVDER